MVRSNKKKIGLFIFKLILGYIFLILFSQIISNKILFQPPQATYYDTNAVIKITTQNGKKISAVYLPSPNSKFVILYSHGNAADLGRLYPILHEFQSHGIAIFAYDYEGYGTSEGYPSEKNSYQDVAAAYDYLTHQLHIHPSQIVAMGDSLGAAVTIDLAIKKKVAGIILQGPFLSAYRVFTIFSILPFDKYNNFEKIKKVTVPILIIHGKADLTIPFWHAQTLFKAAKSKKQLYWVEGASHNDLTIRAGEKYWQTIKNFMSQLSKNNT